MHARTDRFNALLIAGALALVLAGGAFAQASELRVPEDYPTIQTAIDAAVDGDVITVGPGTYVENINFLGKAIHLRSADGAAETVIDGNESGTVVTFSPEEGAGGILEGFTIRNGDGSYFAGGGIQVSGSSPHIIDNIIEDNVACDGAGIHSHFGSPRIEGNIIRNNNRKWCSGGTGGGGIEIGGDSTAVVTNNIIEYNSSGNGGGGGISFNAAGTPRIEGNIIRFNTSRGWGGGIKMTNRTDAEIIQNLIYGNSAEEGGGVYYIVPSSGRGPYLLNNTIVDNDADEGSAVYARGFDADAVLENNLMIGADGQAAVFCYEYPGETPIFRYNNVYSSGASAYSGYCDDQTGINGNISSPPMFLSPGSDNYRLGHFSESIDAGNNAAVGLPGSDFAGNPRIVDHDRDGQATVDMGAYETAQPPPIGEVGQITGLTHKPMTVNFENTYTSPVVFAKPLSFNNRGPCLVRITDVRSDGFTLYIDEPRFQDGRHKAETVSYIVLEAGGWELQDGTLLEVGSVSTKATVGRRFSNSWETIDFSTTFLDVPVVISQVQTNNDKRYVGTRQQNTTADRVGVAMESYEAARRGHGRETIGWMAISSGTGVWSGLPFEAFHTADHVRHSWYTISFQLDYTLPRFVATLASYHGNDSAHLRYRKLNGSSVQVRVEEDITFGWEMIHTTEVVDFIVIDGDGTLTILQ